MPAVLAAADDGDHLHWEFAKALERLAAERSARIVRQRAAEAEQRREWIEGIRRRLGLVAEMHEVEWWMVASDWWMWRCNRPGCYDWNSQSPEHSASSVGPVRAKALAHKRRFMPAAPDPVLGVGLDLTGFWRAGRGLHG